MGYMPPLNDHQPRQGRQRRATSRRTSPRRVVRECDFDNGVTLLPLTTQGQSDVAGRLVGVQGRLEADAHVIRRWFWPIFALAGRRLARPAVPRSRLRRARGRVRDGRPDLLEPGSRVEPAALARSDDATRAAAGSSRAAVLDRLRADVRVRRASRSRAASRSATRLPTTSRGTRGASRRCCWCC